MKTLEHHMFQWLLASLLGWSMLPVSVAQAQDAQQIIEALKPVSPTTRTRSVRNLRVDQVDVAPDTAAGPPSISLTIGFEFNSSTVSSESLQTLSTLAKALQSSELLALKFQIEGHTDGKGKADYNLKLSQARAQAVKQQLEKRGIDGSRLSALGKGDTELANSQDRFAAENRRVKIITMTP